MPDVRIPQTASWITWPGSKHGNIHITTALPLCTLSANLARVDSFPKTLRQLQSELKRGSSNGAQDYVPIELKFPRRSFDLMMQTAAYFQEAHPPEEMAFIRDHLPKHTRTVIGCTPKELLRDWAHAIVEMLHYYGLHCAGKQSRPTMAARWMSGLLPDPEDSQFRQARQTLEGAFGGVSFRLVLRRSGLRTQGALCSTTEGKRDLAFAVRWHLLPNILADWGLNGLPRGRHLVQAQFLQHTASVAIIMAQELMVQIAKGDGTRQAALREIMNQDKYAMVLENIGKEQGTEAVHALQRQIALWLAERTLRPAWEQHKISSPLQLDPNKAYKQLCPPHRRTALRDMLKQLTKLQREAFRTSWFRRLLGPVGRTAIDFELL